MASAVRVIVFNADEDYAPRLRSALLAFEGLKIVAEVDDPVLLPQAATQFPADLAIVHLDPQPEMVLHLAGQVAAEMPELAIFALSESTDGQLILSAMRLGIREFLTKPIDPEMLTAALEKVTQRRVQSVAQGRLITVVGGAGGVGATSVAANLAVELADLAEGPPNRRVALADLDLRFGQVTTLLDVEPTYTIADLCETNEQLEPQLIERVLVEHRSGVRVLARPTHFAQAGNISAAHCVGVLTGLTGMYEYVVVDGPNRFDPGAKAILDLADDILLVMHLVVPCVRNVSRLVEGMREEGFNLDRVKLICNRAGRNSGNLALEDVRETLGSDLYAVLPDDWSAMSGAINLGEPLASFAEKSRIRAAVRDLAERLHRRDAGADEREVGKPSGLFSKIFSDA